MQRLLQNKRMKADDVLLIVCRSHYILEMVSTFAFSFTASVVMLQTMKHVPPVVYNATELIGGMLLVVLGLYLAKDSVRRRLDTYLTLLIIVEFIVFCTVQLLSVSSLVYRFVAVAVVGLIAETRSALLQDYVHGALSGNAITTYNQRRKVANNLGSLLGFATSLVLLAGFNISLSLETALVLQIILSIPVFVFPRVWKDYHTYYVAGLAASVKEEEMYEIREDSDKKDLRR